MGVPNLMLYCQLDPAFDSEESDLQKYIETVDPKYLVAKANETPMKYECRPMSSFDVLNIQEELESGNRNARLYTLFQTHVVKIHNCPLWDDDDPPNKSGKIAVDFIDRLYGNSFEAAAHAVSIGATIRCAW